MVIERLGESLREQRRSSSPTTLTGSTPNLAHRLRDLWGRIRGGGETTCLRGRVGVEG